MTFGKKEEVSPFEPQAFYRLPGNVAFQDCLADYAVANTQEEYDEAISEGWYPTLEEAKTAYAKANEPAPDPVKVELTEGQKEEARLKERADLVEEAVSLGIEVKEDMTNKAIKSAITRKKNAS